ncbi:MAG: tetratricopeptide repeat protein, partial [Myxococcota bacterium]
DGLGGRGEAELAHARRFAAWLRERLPIAAAEPDIAFDELDAMLPHLLVIPDRVWRTVPELAVDVVEHLVEIAQVRGPLEPYLAAADRAVDAALAGAPGRVASALSARASIRLRIGATSAARADLAQARAGVTDPAILAWLDSNRAVADAQDGRLPEAIATLTAAIPALRGLRRVAALANVAALRINHGERSDDVEAATRAALAEALEAGRPIVAASVRANLGLLLARRGRLDEAEAVLVEAIASHRRYGVVRHEVAAIASLAAVRLDQGRLVDADAIAAEAEALARRIVFPQALGAIVAFRAMLELELGDPVDGLRRLDEADALLAVPPPDHPAIRAALLAAAERWADAERVLDGIADPELAAAAAAHVRRQPPERPPHSPVARYLARCAPGA